MYQSACDDIEVVKAQHARCLFPDVVEQPLGCTWHACRAKNECLNLVQMNRFQFGFRKIDDFDKVFSLGNQDEAFGGL